MIGENEADGILYTEHMVYEAEISDPAYPKVLMAKNVRAAHLYNVAFSHVRQNFAIAGLLTSVQVIASTQTDRKGNEYHEFLSGNSAI